MALDFHDTIIRCPACDSDSGYVKDGKLYRGSSPAFDNYCWLCLKDLTKIINKIAEAMLKNKQQNNDT